MSKGIRFVEESDIDNEKVLASGGANHGDEDFAVFRCPFCHHDYLLEYECDTVFIDPHDLNKRVDVFNRGFQCVECKREVPRGVAWIGPKASDDFRVRYDDMVLSDWAWILKPRSQEW